MNLLRCGFLCVIMLTSLLMSQDHDAKQQALEQALSKQLSKHPQWRTLLHFSGDESQIDDPSFFYSSVGKTDPEAELIATIEAFYRFLPHIPPPENISLQEVSQHPYDTHALCRFRARFDFLNEQLQFKNLPDITCYEYEKAYEVIRPKGVKIVFPASHISAPASMFGHTFLLFESTYESTLLSYALNYAAAADPTKEDPFVFMFKGLFGLYEGRYSIQPYYDSLKEYKDTESRDMWEFKLNLTPEETLHAFNHMWELRQVYSYYYFFDENCSYNLFWILEAARPSLKLREAFFYQVIPPETLFVMQDQHLIEDVFYRPNKRRVIEAYAKKFSYKQTQLIKKKALGEPLKEDEMPDDMDERRWFLEEIIELSEYYFTQSMLDKTTYTDTVHNIAMKRSFLGKGKAIKPPMMQSPLKGHRDIRLFAGMDSSWKGLLGFRLAYHDITESDQGFLEGTQIEFFDILLAYDRKNVKIQDLKLFSVASLSPISSVFQPISYRFMLGASDSFKKDDLSAFAKVGMGMSVHLDQHSLMYYLIEVLGTHDQQAFFLGGVNTFGLLYGGQYPYKIHMEYSNTLYTSFKDHHIENAFKGSFAYHLGTQYALFANYHLKRFNKAPSWSSRHQVRMGLRFYF